MKKKTYVLYLKSHCECPDFEATVKADNMLDAAKQFKEQHKKALREYSIEDIINILGGYDDIQPKEI